MIPVRHFLDRRRGGKADRKDWLVIDLNEDVCSVWSLDTGVVAEPSRVAVTSKGKVEAFGFEADLVGGRRGDGLAATNLFDLDASQGRLGDSFLAWLLKRSKVGPIRGIPVFLPLAPGAAQQDRNPWCRAIENLGGDVVVIHRPIAAAQALGLEVNESSCHLMFEVLETQVDLAVIRAGSVFASHRIERTDHATMQQVVEEILVSLDPDEELDIRDRGVSIYGWSALRYARETISAIGLPLSGPVGRGPTVLNGARAVAEGVLPWLALS